MVKIEQSSWFEYSKERVLEMLSVAPLSVTVNEYPSLSYYFPEGIDKSKIVRYSLFHKTNRLQFLGIISSVSEDSVTVRLKEGPFRGFSAIHSFKRDGALTLCDDAFDFQGEQDSLHEILEQAKIYYNFESRAKAFEIYQKFQKEKVTGSFAAVQSNTAS